MTLDDVVALTTAGEIDAARKALPELERSSGHLVHQYALGFILFSEKNFSSAIACFAEALEGGFQAPWASYFMALAEAHLGHKLESFRISCDLLTDPANRYATFKPALEAHYDKLLEGLSSSPSMIEPLAKIMGDAERRHLGEGGSAGFRSHFLLFRSVLKFEAPVNIRPILITSIRKSGTHAVSAVCRHLVGNDHTFIPFIDESMSEEYIRSLIKDGKRLFVGHVARTPAMNRIFKDAFVILCVRDPITQCISFAHHLENRHNIDPPSLAAQASGQVHLALNYSLFGYDDAGYHLPSMADDYKNIALKWWDRADIVIRFEDIVKTKKGEMTSEELFKGIEYIYEDAVMPDDFQERLICGLSEDVSATYHKRAAASSPPTWLPSLVECLMPNVRSFLGYGNTRP